MMKLGENSGRMHPTLFVGLGEGLGIRYLKIAPQMQICAKTNLSLIVVLDFTFLSEYGSCLLISGMFK